jgi:predicted acetyltransferase
LYLARPSLKDEEDVWRLIDEYNRYEPEIDGIDRFEGIRELAYIKDFKEWILKIGKNRHKENIPSHLVPSTL